MVTDILKIQNCCKCYCFSDKFKRAIKDIKTQWNNLTFLLKFLLIPWFYPWNLTCLTQKSWRWIWGVKSKTCIMSEWKLQIRCGFRVTSSLSLSFFFFNYGYADIGTSLATTRTRTRGYKDIRTLGQQDNRRIWHIISFILFSLLHHCCCRELESDCRPDSLI